MVEHHRSDTPRDLEKSKVHTNPPPGSDPPVAGTSPEHRQKIVLDDEKKAMLANIRCDAAEIKSRAHDLLYYERASYGDGLNVLDLARSIKADVVELTAALNFAKSQFSK